MNDNVEQTLAAPNSDTNNGGANNNNQRNERRTNRAYQGFDQADRKFEGMTPEIGGVLALPLGSYVIKRTTFVMSGLQNVY